MSSKEDRRVDAFNRDVASHSGYLYTTNARLSSQLANRRLTDATLAITEFLGKRVLDIGCGDGTYTLELYDRGKPARIHAVDLAHEAIRVAQQKIGDRQITFDVQSADALSYEANSFDIALLRGVLHHMDRPVHALQETIRVAPIVVVIEPNGNNPGLKVLEKVSRYHREHHEKSYTSAQLARMIQKAGGDILCRQLVGLVPFFTPDWLARMMKVVEPLVERLPLIQIFGCAQQVLLVRRVDSRRVLPSDPAAPLPL